MARSPWGAARFQVEQFLTESSAVAALVLDDEQRVEWLNDGFLRMTGRRAGGVGQRLTELVVPECWAAAERLLREGSPAERLQFLGESGVVFLLTCRVYPGKGRRLILGEALTLTDHDVLQTMSRLNSEAATLARDLHRKNSELQQALHEIKQLKGLLPICSYCKQVRNEEGEWQQLESFVAQRSQAVVSHVICEPCLKKHFPNLGDDTEK